MSAEPQKHENMLCPVGYREWAIERDGLAIAICSKRECAELILSALDALDAVPAMNELIERLKAKAGNEIDMRAALAAAFGKIGDAR